MEDDDVFSAASLYLTALLPDTGIKIWEYAVWENRLHSTMLNVFRGVADEYPEIPRDTFELLAGALSYPRLRFEEFYNLFEDLKIYQKALEIMGLDSD